MATFEEINTNFADDKKKSGLDDAGYAKTAQAKNYNDQLIQNIGNISDAGELDRQRSLAEAQIGDANYGEYAQKRLDAIKTRAGQMTPSGSRGTSETPASPAPGLGSSPLGPPAPQQTPQAASYQLKDDNVESFLPGLLDKSGALMTKARAGAMATMNKRGLQNSSIAAGAGEKAALDVVVPMAQQNATQTAQKNLAAMGFGYNTQLQSQQIQGQKDLALMGYANQQELQKASDAAQKERLGMQLTSEEKRAADDFNNRMALQNATDLAAKDRQTLSDLAQKERLGLQLTSEEKRAKDEAENRIKLQQMSGDQSTKSGAAQMVSNANSTYTNYVSAINSNPNLGPEERNKLIQDAASRRDAEIDLVNSIFGTKLTWSTNGSGEQK